MRNKIRIFMACMTLLSGFTQPVWGKVNSDDLRERLKWINPEAIALAIDNLKGKMGLTIV